MELRNLQLYTPAMPPVSVPGIELAYLKDADDKDWYEAQKKFDADTLKIMYDDAGIICAASIDISSLWPAGCSVSEIAVSAVPDGFATDGSWRFVDGAILAVPVDLAAKAAAQKLALAQAAATAITPLQYAVDLGIATDGEAAQLLAWKKFSVLVNRVDTRLAPEITWPEVPQNVA